MRTPQITAILFLVLFVVGCNNSQTKKAKESDSLIAKPIDEKPTSIKKKIAEKESSTSCDSIVRELVLSSKRYKQLTKRLNKAVINNGGQSFKLSLEGSPNTHRSTSEIHSKTYDFTVYEVYPERQMNAAQFTFDPDNKQLYEYDPVIDTLIPIEFDKNLLVNFESNCK
jgi:hypothetical protein